MSRNIYFFISEDSSSFVIGFIGGIVGGITICLIIFIFYLFIKFKRNESDKGESSFYFLCQNLLLFHFVILFFVCLTEIVKVANEMKSKFKSFFLFQNLRTLLKYKN